MLRYYIVFALLLNACLFSFGQGLSGVVKDKESSKLIPSALVYVIDLEIGTITDSSGRFTFLNSLPHKVKLKVSAFGYESKTLEINTDTQDLVVYLEEKHIELDEVTISDSKGTLQRYNAIHIETRKLNDLNSIAGTTLSESLSNIPGVYQASTGIGISKPVVRGMQGMRVVTMLNGLRIENQQWGGDHGMGITDLGIGSVEVIKGPSSLLFGADALGGVVYFADEPYTKQNTFELGLKTQNESNTLGTNDQIGFKLSKKNYRFSIAGNYSDHADYKLPNGNYALNTRFTEKGVKASFGTNKKNWTMHARYNFSTSRVGIPGESEDTVVTPESFQVSTQERTRLLPMQAYENHFISIDNKFFLKRNEINVLLGQTVNQLSEFEEGFSTASMNTALYNSLYSLRLKTLISDKLKLVSGFQGMFQNNVNKPEATEKLLPNASTLDNGLFSILYLEQGKWNFQTGIRYDLRMLRSLEAFQGFNALSENYESFNFSAGGVRSSKRHTYRLNVSSGFRAPHLSELLANGEHHGALRYEIGNPDLVSEKATQLDLTYELHGHHLELIINPFFSNIQNFISLQPLADSLIDELPVFKYDQIPTVYLYGTDFGIHYHPHFAHWLHLENSLSFIRSDVESGGYLALMPQSRSNTTLKIAIKSKKLLRLNEIALQHVYFLNQNRTAVYETASPSYQLVNASLHFSIELKNPILIDLGVKNVFNEKYLDHLSRLKNIGLNHPGRNVYLTIRYNLTHALKNN
jgi:iron complex outermembrane receptor protein